MNILDAIKLIVLFQLICNLNDVHTSYDDSMDDTLESDDSGSEQWSHHHHHHHRKGHSHASHGEYDDCDCSCSKCDLPSECCKILCASCASDMYQQQAAALSGQSQASVVFVPYPYPLMMPSPMMKSTNPHVSMLAHHVSAYEATTQSTTLSTSTLAPTTTSSTTTTTATSPTTFDYVRLERHRTFSDSELIEPPNVLRLKSQNNDSVLDSVLKSVVDDYSNIIFKTPNKLKNGNNKYMLTSLRRTKPTWIPKFGIVPITDDMAVKLMSQLRSRYPTRAQKRPMRN